MKLTIKKGKISVEEVRSMFESIAEGYDSLAKDSKVVYPKIMYNWVLENVHSKDLKILALGCGTGLAELPFLEAGYEVTGIDLSKKMIEQAKKRPFKKLIVQDIEEPIETDEIYDVVLLFGVMEFIHDSLNLFKNIKKKLNDDGIFAITIPIKFEPSDKTRLTMV